MDLVLFALFPFGLLISFRAYRLMRFVQTAQIHFGRSSVGGYFLILTSTTLMQ
jgi:hypothetical protein